MKKLIMAFSMLLLIMSDQVFKSLSFNYLKPVGSVDLIKGILRLNYVENTGVAFGMLKNSTVIISIFTGIVILFCLFIVFVKPFKNDFYNICIMLIATGGTGNLIDRIFRSFVIDYIEVLFIDFPVFNFADMIVTCSSFLLMFYAIYEVIKEKKQKTGEK